MAVLVDHLLKISFTILKLNTVGAQSIARAQSIAPRHTTYVIIAKKLQFREFLFEKIKKEEFARRIFKKKSVFLPLKWLNCNGRFWMPYFIP